MLGRFCVLMLLLVTSCTVTKRVHRSGWHIEWKKKYTQTNSFQKSEHHSNVVSNENDSRSRDQLDLQLDSSQAVQWTYEAEESGLDQSKSSSQDNLDQSNLSEGSVISTPKDTIVAAEDESEQEKKNVGSVLIVIGAIALSVGVMLVLASLFSLFGISILSGLFNSLVFSGNGFLVGLLGFILFLIILIFLLLFVVIVEFALGGYYVGFIVGFSLIGAGIICLLLGFWLGKEEND